MLDRTHHYLHRQLTPACLLVVSLIFTSSSAYAQADSGTAAQKAQSALGLMVFILICFAMGRLRKPRLPVVWRTVIWGTLLQFIFAYIVLNTKAGEYAFSAVNKGVIGLLGFAETGARFLFGNLVKNNVPVGTPAGDPLMGPVLQPEAYAGTGAFFAFNVLPTIIFFSTLSALLYHIGVLQWVVQALARLMQRTMKTSGSETLSSAANIFLGQTEAPMLVRPFIARATKSELMAIMTGGFANIASGVLAAYVAMLQGFIPDIAGHLLAASIISAPCSLVVAKLLLPESEASETAAGAKLKVEKLDANSIDAASRGALEGAYLAFNVGAMLIAFVALVAMLNAFIGWVGGFVGVDGVSLESILGYGFAPLAWLTGVPWKDAVEAGSLIGVKTALNEFVAYLNMATLLGKDPQFMDMRSLIITSYALCGFANFASIAIQIGGISAMAPERRHDLCKLGVYAMIGGTIASLMTACVVGILI